MAGGHVHAWGSGDMGQLGCPTEELPTDEDGNAYQPVPCTCFGALCNPNANICTPYTYNI